MNIVDIVECLEDKKKWGCDKTLQDKEAVLMLNQKKQKLAGEIEKLNQTVSESGFKSKEAQKQTIDNNIKNQEDNLTDCSTKLIAAQNEVNSAQTAYDSATYYYSKYNHGVCYQGKSPELNSSCKDRYQNALNQKNAVRDSYKKEKETIESSLAIYRSQSAQLGAEIKELQVLTEEYGDISTYAEKILQYQPKIGPTYHPVEHQDL